MPSGPLEVPSAAFFNPQSKAADVEYLNSLQQYLCSHTHLNHFVESIRSLPRDWKTLARHNSDLGDSNQGLLSAEALAQWINTSNSSTIANAMSGSLTLPLLTVIQICQYFQYLENQGIEHQQLLQSLCKGGIHGYCGGLLPAVAVAASTNENELIQNASKALRLALAIGTYGDLGDEDLHGGPTNMVIRVKYPGQGEEIIAKFPGVRTTWVPAYISAVTDPKTISVVGPAHVLKQIKSFTNAQGLLSQGVHIRGKVHNPENAAVAANLERFCTAHDTFQFPDASQLQVSLRSNADGNRLEQQCLTHEVIKTILSTRCEWYQLLHHVAADLRKSDCQSHHLINFGIGDCLSPIPFHECGLKIIKSEARSIIKEATINHSVGYEYPPNAVAVIGMACRYPGANNVEELWDLLTSGRSTVEELRHDRVDTQRNFRVSQDQSAASPKKFYANLIDRCDSFDNEFFGIKPREAVYMDPQQRLLLETSYQAVESSGYLHAHKWDGDHVGVFVGASFVEYLANTSSHPPTAYNSVGTLKAFLCGRISHYFGWTGPAEVIDTACSSSLVAVNRAYKALQSGECSMALAGGINVISSIENFLDLGKAGFLSPTGQCKPFDKDADGYCRSEGVGLLFLKPLSQALQDENHIIGVIGGTATNQGGLSSSITVPHSPSQVILYRDILKQACMAPDKVSYIEAHGTGTQAGDPLEFASIREVFGGPQRDTPLHIGSIKGSIGHCETAAGVAGCIKALVLLQKGAIPPLASHKNLNPKISNLERDRMVIDSGLQPWKAPFRAVCVNSYGAAGSNAAVLLCQAPPRPSADSTKRVHLDEALPFLLSANSKSGLLAGMKDLKTYLERLGSKDAAADVAFTLTKRHEHHRFRWATIARNLSELCQALSKQVDRVAEAPRKARNVVLVFCGQVSRTIGVKRRLYESCGVFRSHLDRCDQIIQNLGLQSLFPSIFQSEPISDIKVLHCGLFSYQYASALSWIESGLQVDAVVGQSFGELTALAVAGILSLKDALTLISGRASLIESQWGPESGAMLSVRCSFDDAQQLAASMKGLGKEIEVACYNAEDSYVMGGTQNDIVATERFLKHDTKYASLRASRVDVTHAYHTKLTDRILCDLESVAGSLEFRKPSIPLETCTQERQDRISPEHIRTHMRDPVYFQDAIRRLEKRLGDCVWLEAGSDSPTFSLAKRAVALPEHHVFQPIRMSDSEVPMQVVCNATVNLWRQGLSVSYWNFHAPHGQGPRQIWLPPYHFQENRHWLPYIDHTTKVLEDRIQSDGTQGQIKEDVETESPQLIQCLKPSAVDADENRFKINTSHPRFRDIVTGHAVVGRPLCPAGMYLECVFLALRLNHGEHKGLAIRFEKCSFESPLGMAPDCNVIMSLRKIQAEANWSFEMSSSVKDHTCAQSVVHARGNVSLVKDVQTEQYQRLVSRRVNELQNSKDLDMLRKDKAYRLFSRVVDYSDIFQGISAIRFADTEAIADLILDADDSSGGFCRAISLDNFLQVCGLLVNSHSICPADSAYLAGGAQSICISETPNTEPSPSFTVYTAFEPSKGNKAMGDVFVLRPDGDVVVTMTGVQFTRVPLKTLARMLDPPREDIKNEAANANQAVKSLRSRVSDVELPKTAVSTTPKPAPLHPETPDTIATEDSNAVIPQRLIELLSQHSGCAAHMITGEATIESLGIDSLARIELKADIETAFSRGIDDSALGPGNTIKDVLDQIGFQGETKPGVATPESPGDSEQLCLNIDLVSIIAEVGTSFPVSAGKCGFSSFWETVAPQIDKLVLAYISRAFRRLGIDLSLKREDEIVPSFKYLPRHNQLVERLWLILERFEIVNRDAEGYVRTSKPVPMLDSIDLHFKLTSLYPNHAVDFSLLALTGPELADCLTGATDPLKLLFGNARAQQTLSDFYHKSPMFATMTDQLLIFLKRVVAEANLEVVRIIEVGAGFGGTTTLLAQMLQDSGCNVQYTFTDVGPTLVDKARKAFSKYPWMDFETLDLEQNPSESLQGKYDIVIATNVVHATSDLVASTSRLRSLLREGGFICLSEITKIIDWYDLVFGLLPGWWCFNDGRSYALQSAEEWVEVFRKAGFESTAYSTGSTKEANSQQLLIGSTRAGGGETRSLHSVPPSDGRYQVQTVAYKTVDDTDIHADIYFPKESSSTRSMPIALMIHGGGFMTLSKTAIRPAQIRFLLAKGVLPISLDYRLCPEINIIDGPMSDVRDAVAWARSVLPNIASNYGVKVNIGKVAVIGWSTGGHLAMTTAWTTTDASIQRPDAILSFYGPSDMEALGDPRSELVLSLFKEGNGLNLFLNGLSEEGDLQAPIEQTKIDAINPIAQVRNGKYQVPTFLIHGTDDEVVPYGMSVAFHEVLEERGIDSGVLLVDGAKHIHDLDCEPGSEMWDRGVDPGYDFLLKHLGVMS
ncbi:MAG: hypothetical protein Q9225_001726 [Loekoesia sp. 1 TL-2023]